MHTLKTQPDICAAHKNSAFLPTVASYGVEEYARHTKAGPHTYQNLRTGEHSNQKNIYKMCRQPQTLTACDQQTCSDN